MADLENASVIYRSDSRLEFLDPLVGASNASDVALVVLTRGGLDDLVNVLEGRVLRLSLRVLLSVSALKDG